MKLIISSKGPDLSNKVDPRFGRAHYFIQYDSATESFVSIDNSENSQAPQGAGVQAAQTVVRTGAEALFTGHCGPKAFAILSEAGIRVYSGFKGTVLDAVQAMKDGSLQPLPGPDRSGHH